MQAYELGCKGCTTYRPNEITGAVLEVTKDKQAARSRNCRWRSLAPESSGARTCSRPAASST